jgi:hypothetical protein
VREGKNFVPLKWSRPPTVLRTAHIEPNKNTKVFSTLEYLYSFKFILCDSSALVRLGIDLF